MKRYPVSIGVAFTLLVLCTFNFGCRNDQSGNIKPSDMQRTETSKPEVGKTDEQERNFAWGDKLRAESKPGVGKIVVFIMGDVKYPGRYFIPVGVNLENVYYIFGGWGGQSDFHGPYKVWLTHKVDGDKYKTSYRIKSMTPHEREAVKLKDGDTLYYEPTI